MEKLGNRIGRSVRNLSTVAIGAGMAVLTQQLGRLVVKGLEYASSLKEQADQLGVTTDALQEYRYAASQAGLSNEEMDGAFAQLTRRIGEAAQGTKAQAEAFAKLGITVKDTKGNVLNAADAIPKIADALEKVKNPAERAAVLTDLFGRAGQKLEPLLAGGSKAVNELREAAHKLGLVLSEEQIQKADDTADKISALNQALSARISGAVADNANAIYKLADSLATLFARAIDFIKTWPRLSAALAGAAAGGALGGPWGAAAGGIAGFAGASALKGSEFQAVMNERQRRFGRADASLARKNLNPAQRRQATVEARRLIDKQLGVSTKSVGPFGLKKTVVNPPAVGPGAITPAEALGIPDPTSIPSAGGGGKKGGGGGGRSGPSAAEIQKRFFDEISGLRERLASAQASLAKNAEDRAELELRQVESARLSSLEDIKTNEDYSAAQKERLSGMIEAITEEERRKISEDKTRELEDDAADTVRQQFDAQRERLRLQLSLADTDAERQRLALELLDLDQQDKRQSLERIAASSVRSDAERALARAALDQLNATAGLERAGVSRSNETQAQAYMRSLRQTPGQINEAIDGIKIDALDSLNDALTDAVMGAKNLGEMFKNVASSIIADLARIAIRRSIIEPLANAIFGGGSLFGGGKIGGNVGGLESNFDKVFRVPAHANGTRNAPGGWSLVGERGMELVKMNRGATVLNNRDTRRALSGGRAGNTVNVYANDSVLANTVKQWVAQGMQEAAGAGSTGAQVAIAVKQSRRFP